MVNKIIHDIKTGGDIIKPFQLGSINFENKLLINYITGKIDDLRIRININDSDVLVLMLQSIIFLKMKFINNKL